MHDYIIVGAGSAGCVMAGRLGANGADVLVIEAGGPDDNRLISIPALSSSLQDTVVDWGYRTVPQVHLNGRRITLPRGRVLGGSSSINNHVYMRGNSGDYDHWQRLGNYGWSYENVLPYFRKAENNSRIRDRYHGTDGPLHVTDVPQRHRLTELFMQAASEAGLARNEDVNGCDQEGFGYFQATIGPAGRCSTAVAYLRPALQRPNIRLVTRALATQVLINNGRATGVRYLTSDGLHTVHAGEIILCGGAINSPQLLLLSGIGPADELKAAGVNVVHDLPGVGKNLQDHLAVKVRYEIRKPLTLFGLSPEVAVASREEYLENLTGLFASNYLEAGAFLRCDVQAEFPDIQVHFLPSFGNEVSDGCAPDRHGFSLVAYVNRPLSRGELRLASPNPMDRPMIDPNYLSAGEDADLMVESLCAMRRIGDAQAFSSVGASEIHPGKEADTHDALVAYIRRTANTAWHQVGTCKMGIDAMAVVNASLQVHGIDNLRVVDASIMPAVVSGNTNAPTIMIAERAIDLMIKDNAALPPCSTSAAGSSVVTAASA